MITNTYSKIFYDDTPRECSDSLNDFLDKEEFKKNYEAISISSSQIGSGFSGLYFVIILLYKTKNN